MIKLEMSQLPERVSTALVLRGAHLPPLQWSTNPSRAAGTLLGESASLPKLICRETVADEAMASAVLAMLYLWNGFVDDCRQIVQSAPDGERIYVLALCDRHTGEVSDAKTQLQQLETHPIYPDLIEFTKEEIEGDVAPLLKRFRDMLEFAGEWEAFTFLDVYGQARLGKLDHASELIVRRIQCREFELLLVHCLEAAAGEPIAKIQQPKPVKRKPPPRPPTRRTPRRPEPAAASPGPAKDPPPPKPRSPSSKVGVLCPKCREMRVVPAARRGTPTQCGKCGTRFMVPGTQAAPTTGQQ